MSRNTARGGYSNLNYSPTAVRLGTDGFDRGSRQKLLKHKHILDAQSTVNVEGYMHNAVMSHTLWTFKWNFSNPGGVQGLSHNLFYTNKETITHQQHSSRENRRQQQLPFRSNLCVMCRRLERTLSSARG